MIRRVVAIACILVFAAASSAPAADVVFEGEVARPQTYEHPIRDSLVFQVRIEGGDWIIWIGETAHLDDDFARVVTPPLHGPHALDVMGWHFRNADNTGPGDGGGNAPPKLREFDFVTNRRDYDRAWSALDCFYIDCNDLTTEQWNERYRTGPLGSGSLTFRELELDHLGAGQTPSVRRFSFKVELHLPEPAETPSVPDARKTSTTAPAL